MEGKESTFRFIENYIYHGEDITIAATRNASILSHDSREYA